MGDRHVVDVIPDEHERSWPRWVALYVLVLAGALLGVHAPGGPRFRAQQGRVVVHAHRS